MHLTSSLRYMDVKLTLPRLEIMVRPATTSLFEQPHWPATQNPPRPPRSFAPPKVPSWQYPTHQTSPATPSHTVPARHAPKAHQKFHTTRPIPRSSPTCTILSALHRSAVNSICGILICFHAARYKSCWMCVIFSNEVCA